jgi:ATP-dependent RNA helicase HelY
LEFLSQLHGLRATHPSLADCASQAIALLRRAVLEELP